MVGRIKPLSIRRASIPMVVAAMVVGSTMGALQPAGAQGTTVRVSVSTLNEEANGHSYNTSISADGRFIAFQSGATNLVTPEINRSLDVFVKDRLLGTTTRASATAIDSLTATADSLNPAISGDGRYVAFESDARTLVAGDTNNVRDIFVYEMDAGIVSRVSVSTAAGQSNGWSTAASISGDGRYIAFMSIASNLVAGDTNGAYDIFVHDRVAGTTSRVSVGPVGAQSNGESRYPSISADGRYISFESDAGNLVAGDTNGVSDIFVHDRVTGTTTRVSVDSSGAQAIAASTAVGTDSLISSAISADGGQIAFQSSASNLVTGDLNGKRDVFRHDRLTGQTTRVSVASSGSEGNGDSISPSITANGQIVEFQSLASNLVTGDTNGTWDVFVRNTGDSSTTRASAGERGWESNAESRDASIAANGNSVAFSSTAYNLLLSEDLNGAWDVFVRDEAPFAPLVAQPAPLASTPDTSRVSQLITREEGNSSSFSVAISANGRYIAFHSNASNLVPSDTNAATDVFVYDRETLVISRVSVSSAGGQGDGPSEFPSISADGRYVTFHSNASNLVAGDTNAVRDVFHHDRQTGETVRGSVSTGGVQGNAESALARISGDGRLVVFQSQATNLGSSDVNQNWDVFVRNLDQNTTSMVSVRTDGLQGNDQSLDGSISLNGRFVTFSSRASNLVSGDTNKSQDVFVRDLQTGATTRASLRPGGSQANWHSGTPSLSGAGRYVAFQSVATNIIPGEPTGRLNVFVHDRLTRLTTRVSNAAVGAQTNGQSGYPSISHDGCRVAFHSAASNLVPLDANAQVDVFVHHRLTRSTTLASVASWGGTAAVVAPAQGNGHSQVPSLSSTGRYVAFESLAKNLVLRDTNSVFDVFLRDLGGVNTTEPISLSETC